MAAEPPPVEPPPSAAGGALAAHGAAPIVGWTGRYFEDFVVGDRYRHPIGRTVTETDNIWLTLLTQNNAPIHIDRHYAAQTEFGRPLVDSTFPLALVTGQSVIDVSQHVFANLGWDEVRLPAPVFEGDTIYSQSEVLAARTSRSRPEVGIVTVATVGFNQEGTVVISFKRTLMVYRRGFGPSTVAVQPREEPVDEPGGPSGASGIG
jgi:acyl dehydratase